MSKADTDNITVNQIRKLLKNTDWKEYNRRVNKEVQKKAEEYRKAEAESLSRGITIVFK